MRDLNLIQHAPASFKSFRNSILSYLLNAMLLSCYLYFTIERSHVYVGDDGAGDF
jgi:hypothetical protein